MLDRLFDKRCEKKNVWKGPSPDITIRLYADGVEVDQVLLPDGLTAHTFENYPIYNVDGTEIVYTITEDEVPGYLSEVESFTVTNTFMILPPTGTSNSIALPLLGMMLALGGIGILRTRRIRK